MNDNSPQETDRLSDPLFCAGVSHIHEVMKRAQAGSWEDEILIRATGVLRATDSAAELVLNYVRLAQDLRRHLLEQLAKRQGVDEQGELFQMQIEKLLEAYTDVCNRFDAAIDAADSAYVDRTRGLCSLIVARGQSSAGIRYLLEECKAYDRAKGDYKLRRALYAGLVDLTASVVEASEKKSPSSAPIPCQSARRSLADSKRSPILKRPRHSTINTRRRPWPRSRPASPTIPNTTLSIL